MTGPRILVIDGNVAEIRARQVAALGYDSGTGYARVLHRIDASLQIDIVFAADGDPQFPAGVSLDDYDGVTMTGSALNIYNGGAPVMRQIDLAKAVFAAGAPFFGSCWGLQVAVTAAGGEVHANPQGREFGFARHILLTDAGREHPVFADVDIAAAAERYGGTLVSEGTFRDNSALSTFAADLRALQANPSDTTLLRKHGLGPAMQIEALRLLEIHNWLQARVLPRRKQRD
jgi:GMP synthase (glutamine-hydrolysing)